MNEEERLRRYLEEAVNESLLSKQEEHDLALAMQGGDLEALTFPDRSLANEVQAVSI
jgi:hypothetical protein